MEVAHVFFLIIAALSISYTIFISTLRIPFLDLLKETTKRFDIFLFLLSKPF